MANICSNKLTIKGDSQQLKHFISKIKDKKSGDQLLLERIYPVPAGIVKMDEQDDWKHEVWGTSFIYECNYEVKNETVVHLHFLSRWSPPIGWVRYVAKQYGKLSFSLKYDEPGIGFYGSFHAKGPNTRDFRSVSFYYPEELYKSNPCGA